jgi:hypothetical protein
MKNELCFRIYQKKKNIFLEFFGKKRAMLSE